MLLGTLVASCKLKLEIANKYLLAAVKLMLEMHLKHSGLTYSAFGSFTTDKEINEKLKK